MTRRPATKARPPAQVAPAVRVRPTAPPTPAPLEAAKAGGRPVWLRTSRYGLALVAAGEGVLLIVAVALALAFPVDTTPHPERVTTELKSCDLGLAGAAQISFTVANGDRAEHSYQVNMIVSGQSNQLGAGTLLVNHVGRHTTATARALVPVSGNATGAVCQLRAIPFDGETGHHGA